MKQFFEDITFVHCEPTDRIGHIDGDASFLASMYMLDLEVTPIGDSLDPLDTKRFHAASTVGARRPRPRPENS